MRRTAVVADVLLFAALAVAASMFGVVLVSGGSMRPSIAQGDLAVYRRGAEGVACGDMVLLGRRGYRFVHRVVSVTPEGLLVTRGDANPIPDREPTATAAVRGKVVAVVPSGALFVRLARSAGNARLWSQSIRER